MKNKTWTALFLSGLLGVALFAPMLYYAENEMLDHWYPNAYQWLVLAAGFSCALFYPRRIWIYPLGMFLGPALVFSFTHGLSINSPHSTTMGLLLFFSIGISGIGAVGGWLIRFIVRKLQGVA